MELHGLAGVHPPSGRASSPTLLPLSSWLARAFASSPRCRKSSQSAPILAFGTSWVANLSAASKATPAEPQVIQLSFDVALFLVALLLLLRVVCFRCLPCLALRSVYFRCDPSRAMFCFALRRCALLFRSLRCCVLLLVVLWWLWVHSVLLVLDVDMLCCGLIGFVLLCIALCVFFPLFGCCIVVLFFALCCFALHWIESHLGCMWVGGSSS